MGDPYFLDHVQYFQGANHIYEGFPKKRGNNFINPEKSLNYAQAQKAAQENREAGSRSSQKYFYILLFILFISI